MKFLYQIIGLLVLFSACKKSTDSTDSTLKTEATPVQTEQNIIPTSLLEKSNVSVKVITPEEFKSAPNPEEKFQKVRTLCEKSEGYSTDIWEGVNECSWAVEQERIKLQSGFVSREENRLILQMEKLALSLEHNPEAPAGSTFYQFKSYLTNSKYFLIEEMISGKCIRSKLINATNSNQYNIKGSMIPSKDGKHFIAYYPKIGPSPVCVQKIESYNLNPDGLHKNWHFPLNNKSITGIKYIEEGKLLVATRFNNKPEENPEYFQLTWH